MLRDKMWHLSVATQGRWVCTTARILSCGSHRQAVANASNYYNLFIILKGRVRLHIKNVKDYYLYSYVYHIH